MQSAATMSASDARFKMVNCYKNGHFIFAEEAKSTCCASATFLASSILTVVYAISAIVSLHLTVNHHQSYTIINL